MKQAETDNAMKNEGKDTRMKDVSVALNLETSLGNRKDENKSPRDDEWCDEMYDDLEIEIDENEVLETDDVEEPMSTELNDCFKNSTEIQTKLKNERKIEEMDTCEKAEACPNMGIKNGNNHYESCS